MLTQFKNQIPYIDLEDIGWVITVPAIWNDSAKKLMRLAAEHVSQYVPVVADLSCFM